MFCLTEIPIWPHFTQPDRQQPWFFQHLSLLLSSCQPTWNCTSLFLTELPAGGKARPSLCGGAKPAKQEGSPKAPHVKPSMRQSKIKAVDNMQEQSMFLVPSYGNFYLPPSALTSAGCSTERKEKCTSRTTSIWLKHSTSILENNTNLF